MARPRLISDEQILDATRVAVNEFGPGVSLDVVAGKLGVSQPALLKRFGTRRELLISALKPPSEPEYAPALTQGPDGRPLVEQVGQLVEWLTTYFETYAPRIAALRESGIPMCDVFPDSAGEPAPLRIKRGIADWLARAQARGLLGKDLDLDTCAFSMVAIVSSRAHLRHIFQKSPIRSSERAFMKSITEFFVRALGPAPAVHPRRRTASPRPTRLSRRTS